MQIQVHQYEFTLSSPFSAGHVCTFAEAKALNVMRSERIRNSILRLLARAEKKNSNAFLSQEGIEQIRKKVLEIEENFQFFSHGNVKSKVSTLEAEVKSLAEALIKERLRKELGHEPEEEFLTKYLAENLASFSSLPELQEQARVNLLARGQVAAQALAELLL